MNRLIINKIFFKQNVPFSFNSRCVHIAGLEAFKYAFVQCGLPCTAAYPIGTRQWKFLRCASKLDIIFPLDQRRKASGKRI